MRTFVLVLVIGGLVGGLGFATYRFVQPEIERWRKDDLERQRKRYLESPFVAGTAESQWLTDDERYYVVLASCSLLAGQEEKRIDNLPKRDEETGLVLNDWQWPNGQWRDQTPVTRRYTVAQYIAEGRDYEKAQAELAGVPLGPSHFPIAASGIVVNLEPGQVPMKEDSELPRSPYVRVWFGNPLRKKVTSVHGRATVYDKLWQEVGPTEIALTDGLAPWETKSKVFVVDLARVRGGQAGMPYVATFEWTRIDFADGTSFTAPDAPVP